MGAQVAHCNPTQARRSPAGQSWLRARAACRAAAYLQSPWPHLQPDGALICVSGSATPRSTPGTASPNPTPAPAPELLKTRHRNVKGAAGLWSIKTGAVAPPRRVSSALAPSWGGASIAEPVEDALLHAQIDRMKQGCHAAREPQQGMRRARTYMCTSMHAGGNASQRATAASTRQTIAETETQSQDVASTGVRCTSSSGRKRCKKTQHADTEFRIPKFAK